MKKIALALFVALTAPLAFATIQVTCPAGQTLVGDQCFTYALTISPVPIGGVIRDEIVNLNCGHVSSVCSIGFYKPTTVVLFSFPFGGYIDGSWTGVCAWGPLNSCKVEVKGLTTISKNFPVAGTSTFTLTSSRVGSIMHANTNGSCPPVGVVSAPAACYITVVAGGWHKFLAMPVAGYVFSSWGGACAGQSNPCNLLADVPKSFSVSFTSQ